MKFLILGIAVMNLLRYATIDGGTVYAAALLTCGALGLTYSMRQIVKEVKAPAFTER